MGLIHMDCRGYKDIKRAMQPADSLKCDRNQGHSPNDGFNSL